MSFIFIEYVEFTGLKIKEWELSKKSVVPRRNAESFSNISLICLLHYVNILTNKEINRTKLPMWIYLNPFEISYVPVILCWEKFQTFQCLEGWVVVVALIRIYELSTCHGLFHLVQEHGTLNCINFFVDKVIHDALKISLLTMLTRFHDVYWATEELEYIH